MFQTNLKIAWRNLTKQKMFSVIKIGGFAVGIAVCLLIALFIRDELSYDQHYPKADRIFKVISVFNDDGTLRKGAHFPAPFAKALLDDFPEIEKVGRVNAGELFGAGSREIRRANEMINHHEDGFVYIDQHLLEIFETPMVYGNFEDALSQANSIVLTKKKADIYFPNQNPIGQTLILDNDAENSFIVGGVIENLPPNSHFQYEFFMSMTRRSFWEGEQEFWRASNYITYVLVKPETQITQLEKKLLLINQKYLIPSMKEAGMKDPEFYASRGSFELQSIKDIYLKSEGIQDGNTYSDIRFIWIFGTIAIFTLLLAVINFVNLSTAKSANRAKEVGLRKTVGAFRSDLIQQFLIESLLFSFISFGLAVFLAWSLLPYFNQIAVKALSFPWESWWLLPSMILFATTVGLLAGLYPAFYLSGFDPIQVLKGKLSKGSRNIATRSGLVIFQFTTSIILIIGSLVIYQQVSYILNKDLGYDKEQVVLLQGTNTLGNKLPLLKERLLQLSEVQHASVSDYLPVTEGKQNGNTFWKAGKSSEERGVPGQFWEVDHDYVHTFGMEIIAGRDFNPAISSDSTTATIINENLVNELNLSDPIGKIITNGRRQLTIIGVVKDFHFLDMKKSIGSACLTIGNSNSILSVKVNTGNMPQLIRSLTTIWEEVSPNQAIRYSYLGRHFSDMHEPVQRMASILTSFTFFAILVACLGLFALSAFLIEQRKKEISIRLVLGASFKSIYYLITINFLKLVLIAFLVAIPIAWYVMQEWLQGFAYRVSIGWEVFVAAGIIAFFIAILTISYQSIGAALINPVDNLKSE
ncbi:MAG: ABC transporter permease [Saprospiraceae bacterium]